MVKDENSALMGEKIIVSGLFVQIIFFTFFVVVAAVFEMRMAKQRIVVRGETEP
ncbi:hypothetical protein DIZ76_011208 [Coccidioides immitis]|nr:hypothetical protein DIZ76_011208 [Coccidioides immitis]